MEALSRFGARQKRNLPAVVVAADHVVPAPDGMAGLGSARNASPYAKAAAMSLAWVTLVDWLRFARDRRVARSAAIPLWRSSRSR